MSSFIIYALVDPRTDTTRYIGRSSTGMKRPQFHGLPCSMAKKTHKTAWIASLRRDGVDYVIRVLEECAAKTELAGAERKWISLGRKQGWDLVNQTPGGEGGGEMVRSSATKEKIRAARIGKQHSAATRQKIGELGRGRRHTAETRAKMSATRRSKQIHHTPETIAKIRAAKTGHAVSESTRQKISESLRRRAQRCGS